MKAFLLYDAYAKIVLLLAAIEYINYTIARLVSSI